MTPKTKEMIEDLEVRINASSLSEVIKKAVHLLDVVTTEQEKGKTVVIRDEKKKTEQNIVIL